MTIIIDSSGRTLHLDDHLERLKGLVADIESLSVDGDATHLVGGNAVNIHGWSPSTRPAPCLHGTMEGHPSVRDGRLRVTSDLWVWAPGHGLARTLSRCYTVGPNAIRDGRH